MTTPAPLRVILIDDEPLARARARRMLAELGGAVVVGEASDVDQAAELLAHVAADVILLDVQMPGGDGFSLLPRLTQRPAVIFVTAFDQYAVRAFEENAVDYLLKPFRPERLAKALDRARAELAQPEDMAKRLDALLSAVGPRAQLGSHLERLTVRLGN